MKYSLLSVMRILGRITAPTILVMIWVLSLLPGETVAHTGWITLFGDKIAHGLSYAAFACSLMCALVKDSKQTGYNQLVKEHQLRILIVFSTVIVLGTGAEIIQPFFGRAYEFFDIVADVCGGIIGIAVGVGMITVVQRVERRCS
jgi:VanZ family protein